MPSIQSILALTVRSLEQSGVASARLDAAVLLAHSLGVTREKIAFSMDKELQNDEIAAFNLIVTRRSRHEPLAYITGQKEFWSLDFCVTCDTLIPRPDSETLVEAVLKHVKSRMEKRLQSQATAKPMTLLDIGTGSGCLLIALLKELPWMRGIGVDTNERALQVAEKNAQRHGVETRARFVKSHWCDALDGTFDLIISNPPYIALADKASLMPDVADYEPHEALFAGEDGLDAYRALAPRLARRLAKDAATFLEVGQGQAESVRKLLQEQGLILQESVKDLAGIERCVIAAK